ncbi:unnamed protein product [Ceutorhynchus assimilis]|uniref:Peroxisomal membrane protein PEX14 n=1 Tax=Ceutorhynchus assimilis TaxID=467358 RepID=A0A9N9MRI0_9CUCU|nr:unnamed protein product [Ceutorhynchus assimilis]
MERGAIMETNNGEEREKNIGQSSSMREDLIDTAVKFLLNPKVISSPLCHKQQFLQKRGLTEDEIKVACERSEAYEMQTVSCSGMSPSLPPRIIGEYGRLQLSLFDRIRDIVHSVAMFSVVAHLIKKIYDSYIAPFLFGTKKKSIRDKIKDVEGSIKDLQCSLGEVKTEVSRINFSSENELVSQLEEIKFDIASVKEILLTRKQVTNSNVPPSISAWQLSSVHKESENGGDNKELKEELLIVGSGSESSEEHFADTSESSLDIINREDIV